MDGSRDAASDLQAKLQSKALAAVCCIGIAAGCVRTATPTQRDESATPVRGGTLEIVAFSDVDHLATTSAYVISSMWLNQLSARQLLGFPPSPDNAIKIHPAPDLARAVPTLENGGISGDGLTYTVHLRRGVRWNSTPPRDVVAADVVRGFKLLCNPVNAAGSLLFFRASIAGLDPFCTAFEKVPGTVTAIRAFVNSNSLEGVRAIDDSTVFFRLVAASADFVNLLALPQASPVPAEYLDYLPDGPEFRQHTIANGPYQLVQYVQNRHMIFERNPSWSAESDQLHAAYVDRVRVRMGVDAQLQLLQIQAGTADLGAEPVRATDLGPLLASGDPNVWLSPSGDMWGGFDYLGVNRLGPDAARALGQRDVRRAIALAVDKAALVQVSAGARVVRPLHQAVASNVAGFVKGRNFYATTKDRGDPAEARRLLAKAGFDSTRVLRLAYPIAGPMPMIAQVLQASLKRAGIEIKLTPVALGEYYGRLLSDTANARRGEWDLALVSWYPDWFGHNNGRAVFPTLFDGRDRGSSSPNYGGFENSAVDAAIDRAAKEPTEEGAAVRWSDVAKLLMQEVATVPLLEEKTPYARSRRVRGCTWSTLGINCDLTAVWLADAASRTQASR